MPQQHLTVVAVLALLLAATQPLTAAEPNEMEGRLAKSIEHLRPPAVPLVTCDPYFSIWSQFDKLTDGPTTHWTGREHRLTGLVRVDGNAYRIMGRDPAGLPAMRQTGLRVWPTRTVYTFEGDGVRVALTFMTPLLPDDLMVCARPLTYLTWTVQSTDGQRHDVALYFDADAELTVNNRDQAVVWSREAVGDLVALRVGSEAQPMVEKRGDDLRIDWGYLYVAADHEEASASLAPMSWTRGAFFRGDALPEDISSRATPVELDAPVLAVAFDLGSVAAEPVERHLLLAYDDVYSIRYFYEDLRPYWRKDGAEAADLLKIGQAQYDDLRKRCVAFDTELVGDLVDAGGDAYAQLGVLSHRQALAAQKLVADANGQLIMMSKENNSNGCIATVDVLYPAAPQMLLFSPTMLKASMQPLLAYAGTDLWQWDSAPHDLGQYPHATGQVYGGNTSAMPVEESGNMLILMAAVCTVEDNADFAEQYWGTLEEWYHYLVREGLDPAEQLCTDDFAGHLARNANLSVKAIMGIAGFGRLCELTGRDAEAKRAFATARKYAQKWMELADDGDHYVLAFGASGTWSQKYNLVWDKLLELDVFPSEVVEREVAYYAGKMNKYGLPLDSRRDYTKLDWEVWTATLANDDADFRRIIDTCALWANETPQRVPMTDWYDTVTGNHTGFKARSVVGGTFIGLLRDKQVWKKYASRDKTRLGKWAAIPIDPPKMRQFATTADAKKPAVWRYTTQRPGNGWQQPDFNDRAWKQGESGFGTSGTPFAVVNTRWDSEEIYLRRNFQLPDQFDPQAIRLWMAHDDDIEIHINGIPALKLGGYRNDYSLYKISAEGLASLKPGRNTLAVTCKQTGGGQFVDVGVVELQK